MMWRKRPEFLNEFEVVCSVSGSTEAQAEYFYELDKLLKTRWIRGEVVEEKNKHTFTHSDGTYTVYSKLIFKKQPLEENKNGSTTEERSN